MAILRKYQKDGQLVHTYSGAPQAALCYMGGGYYLSIGNRSLQQWCLDGKTTKSIKTLINYATQDFSGKGVCINHSHKLSGDLQWDGNAVFTVEEEAVSGGGIGFTRHHFRHYEWNESGTLTLVNSDQQPLSLSIGAIEYDGSRVWFRLQNNTIPNSNLLRQYDYSGKTLANHSAVGGYGTGLLTDIAYDGLYFWRLRASVPEVVQDMFDGKTRDAQNFWTPSGTVISGIMTDGEYIYVSSET